MDSFRCSWWHAGISERGQVWKIGTKSIFSCTPKIGALTLRSDIVPAGRNSVWPGSASSRKTGGPLGLKSDLLKNIQNLRKKSSKLHWTFRDFWEKRILEERLIYQTNFKIHSLGKEPVDELPHESRLASALRAVRHDHTALGLTWKLENRTIFETQIKLSLKEANISFYYLNFSTHSSRCPSYASPP